MECYQWSNQSRILKGMKAVNYFNMEDLVTNEWPKDLIGGNINVSELLDAPEYAKINHARNSYNWF
jgi:hypothetical protein